MEPIGDAMLRMFRGRKQKSDSLSDECPYCGQQLIPGYPVEIKGETFYLGPKRCTCDGFKFQEQKKKQEQEEKDRQRQEAERQQRIDQLFRDSKLPDRWRTRTFESFEITSKNKQPFMITREFVNNFERGNGHGLLLTGPVGTGKTHLVAAASMDLIGRGYSVVFGTITTLLQQLRNTYDSDHLNEMDIMRKFTKCDLLVIDELGKEKVSPWVVQTVYELINTRYEWNKSFLVTTNLSLENIRKRYNDVSDNFVGDAIADRILETCQGVRVEGESWRRKTL